MHDPGQSASGDEDVALMLRVKAGDREAFEPLVRRHRQPLLNFFARMGAYRDAEDMAQDTFVRVFRYRRRYRPRAKFTTFLYTVARHVWLDALRKARRRDAGLAKLEAEQPPADDRTGRQAGLRLDVRAALDSLPEKLRAVVVLAVYQGLRYEEIARILRVPAGTVKSRMFTAMGRLREMFGEDTTS